MPLRQLAAKAKERGWSILWYSSYGSDFNYAFQVTLDAVRGLVDYNYRPEPQAISGEQSTERPGYSCFLRVDFIIMGQSGPHLAKPAHDHGARRRVRSQCRLA